MQTVTKITPAVGQPQTHTFAKIKATVYSAGAFGIDRTEVLLTEIRTGVKYAQYNNAGYIRYIPKGKRTVTGISLTYSPFAIVLEGHGHPAPDSGFVPLESSIPGTTISKYGCFSDEYRTDFAPAFDAYCIANNITPIFDARGMQTS